MEKNNRNSNFRQAVFELFGIGGHTAILLENDAPSGEIYSSDSDCSENMQDVKRDLPNEKE